MITKDYIPEYCKRRVLILGCGNVLLGDDGIGPEVIAHLEGNKSQSKEFTLLDVGTGVVDILFNIVLSDVRPRRLILIDAMDMGKPPGAFAIQSPRSCREHQIETFSQHGIPTSNLLRELEQLGIEVTLIAVQPGKIPDEIRPGLSEAVRKAIPGICEWINLKIKEFQVTIR